MDGNKLFKMKNMVKEALGISDAAQLLDFHVATNNGTLIIEAKLRVEVSIDTQGPGDLVKSVKVREIKPKQVGKNKRRDPDAAFKRTYNANPQDFKVIRNLLGKWRRERLLTAQEVMQMGEFAGKFFTTMTEEERGDLLAFFNKVRKEITSGNRNLGSNKETQSQDNEEQDELVGANAEQ